MKRAVWFVVLIAATAAAQVSLPNPQSRVAGRFVAFNYGGWSIPLYKAPSATGSHTFSPLYNTVTLPDGRSFMPFATNAPLYVGSELVTVTAVGTGCVLSSAAPGTCVLTATFSSTHTNAERLSSGTFGLQEALDDAGASGGGAVTVDSAWAGSGGTSGMIAAATLPSNTGIEDARAGSPAASFVNGQPISPSSVTASGTVKAGTTFIAGTGYNQINVKALGATGNGSIDDHVAINAAFSAVSSTGGGTVYFPIGIYSTSTSIAVPVNTSILCDQGASLKFTGATDGLVYSGATAASIRDCTLVSYNVSSAKAVSLTNSVDLTFINVDITANNPAGGGGMWAYGYWFSNSDLNTFHGGHIQTAVKAVHFENASNANGFFGLDISENWTGGPFIESIGTGGYSGINRFYGGAVEGVPTGELMLISGDRINTYGVHFETANNAPCVVATGGYWHSRGDTLACGNGTTYPATVISPSAPGTGNCAKLDENGDPVDGSFICDPSTAAALNRLVARWDLAGAINQISGNVATSYPIANDSSGYAQPLTMGGTQAGSVSGTNYSTPGVVAAFPYSEYFNGSTNLSSFPGTPLSGSGDFTMCAWVKFQTVANAYLFITGSSPNVVALSYLASTGWQVQGATALVSGVTATANTPYRACMVGTGGTAMTIYINGSSVATGAITYSISGSGNNFIGNYASGGTGYTFNGWINDVRIYNRAWSAAEITQDYAAQN